jgi:uncharacterized protein (TIGR03118 family)
MKKITQQHFRSSYGNGRLLFFSFLLLSSVGCQKFLANLNHNKQAEGSFSQVNLVSNNPQFGAAHSDSSLQNAWGLAWAPSGIAWVNSQAGHVSELYDSTGAFIRKGVNIPSPVDSVGGNPTGIVFNSVPGFTLPNGKAANFIFVGVDGVLSAWNGAAGNNAFRIGTGGSKVSYTGLALASFGGANYLYAADFGSGRIAVWDTGFVAVTWMHFHDPNLPNGYAPFNIRSIGSWLYVTYAKVGADGRSEAGLGKGFVDIFKTDGSWVNRFAAGGALNAPWGIEQAPVGFLINQDIDDQHRMSTDDGHGGGNGGPGDGNGNGNSGPGNNNGNNDDKDNGANQPAILVGNFGDGRINAYTLDGNFIGQLASHNHTIVIDKLWALSFAPTTAKINPGKLFFTAGPNEEKDGLFGYLIRQ